MTEAAVETAHDVRKALNEPAPAQDAPAKIDEAIERFKEAQLKISLGVMLLNDAEAFFEALDPAARARAVKPIGEFLKKAEFNLATLIDEVKSLRSLPRTAPAELPAETNLKIDVITAATLASAGAKLEPAELEALKKTRLSLAVALRTVAHFEVPVAESKPYVDCCEMLAASLKDADKKLVANGVQP